MDNLNPERTIQTRKNEMRSFARGMYGNRIRFNEGGEGGTDDGNDDGGADDGGKDDKGVGGMGFVNSLSEETRGNPSMQKFEKSSNEDIAKSYISLQGKISAKGLTIPGPNADDDERTAFHKALGRPETADGYKIQVDKELHKDIVSDEGTQKAFKEQAHKLGMAPEAVQGLHSWYLNETSNAMKQKDEADETARNEASTALQSRWGTGYDDKLAMVQKVVDKFGGKNAEDIRETYGNDPKVLEMLANIGSSLSEDTLGPGGKSKFGGMSPAAAEAKIAEIKADTNHPFNNDGSLHQEAVDEMNELYKIKFAGAEG